MKFVLSIIFQMVVFTQLGCSHSSQKTKIAAHRGASGYLPEHTLEAYTFGYALNVDFIEPDIVATKDQKLILLHDIYLDSTTNVSDIFPNRKRSDGRFYAVDFTLKEIKQLLVRERFNVETKTPIYPQRFPISTLVFRVPTFEEFLNLIDGLNHSRSQKMRVLPEIKDPEFHKKNNIDIALLTLNTLQNFGYEKSALAIIQCFEPLTLKRLSKMTRIKLLQLIADPSWNETSADYKLMMSPQGLAEVKTYADYVGVWIPHLFEKDKNKSSLFLESLKHTKLKIFAFTHRIDDYPSFFENLESYHDALKQLSLYGLFSDHPDKAQELFE